MSNLAASGHDLGVLPLALGLVLFLGIHALPSFPGPRERLIARLGEASYKGLFSLVSLAGLVLILVGKSRAPFVFVYAPLAFGRMVALALMLPALVLLAAAYVPGRLRRRVRHPMLLAVALWGAVHLLANGDLAALLLFGSFFGFALLDLWSVRGRAGVPEPPVGSWAWDGAALAIGALAYAGIARFHAELFGVPVVGW